MPTPESRLVLRLPEIERALTIALEEGAGEPMAFVLMVAPVGRKGVHLVSSNIKDNRVIVTFLRDAANVVMRSWKRAQQMAEDMADRTFH